MSDYDDNESESHHGEEPEHTYTNNNTENLSFNLDENDIEDENKFNEQERLAMLWRIFDDKQKARYEKYKTSGLENRKKNRSTHKIECPRTKKIVQNILGETVQISNQVQIVLHGIAKIYAGELVEEAKTILVDKEGLKSRYPSIRPCHLREARRRMIQRGILPRPKFKKLFDK